MSSGSAELREPVGPGDRRQPRPLALDEPELRAERLRHEEDVGEQDRRVEAEAPDRLHRDLGGELGIVAQGQEVPGLRPRRLVLRQIPPRLPHHPDRRDGQGLARERAQQGLRHGSRSVRASGWTRPVTGGRWCQPTAPGGPMPDLPPSDLPTPDAPLRIGTRGSPLALAQARETRARLMAAHGMGEDAFEIVVIQTTGDRVQDRPLSEIGGKGLFTREIEADLLAGTDRPRRTLDEGHADAAARGARDRLPPPARGPARRLRHARRPRARGHARGRDDRHVVAAPARAAPHPAARPARGGVSRQPADADGQAARRRGGRDVPRDGRAVAARDGRRAARGDRGRRHASRRSPRGRSGWSGGRTIRRVAALLAPIHDGATGLRLDCERSFLATLDGSCETPIAGLAVLDGARLRFRGEILRPDGSDLLMAEGDCPFDEGANLGRRLAKDLLSRAPADFFEWRA